MCAHGVYWLVDPSTSQALDGAMWVDSNPKDREHTTLDGLGWHESVTTISSPRVDEIRVASLVISPAKPAAYRLELCVLEPGETVKTHASTNTPFPISRLSTPTSPYSPTRGPKFFPARGDPLYRGGKVFPGEAGGEKKGGDPQSMISKHPVCMAGLHAARCSLFRRKNLEVMEKIPSLENTWKALPCLGKRYVAGPELLQQQSRCNGSRHRPAGWVGNPGISPRAGQAQERVERCCQRLDVLPRRRGKTRTAVIIIKTRQRWCKKTPSSRKTWWS